MSPKLYHRLVATALVATMALAGLGPPSVASAGARLEGRVLSGDDLEPRHGVVVSLVDVDAQRRFSSGRTDDRGRFVIDSAPAGTYALVAEAAEGAFLASPDMEVVDGDNPPVAIALSSRGEVDPETIAKIAPAAGLSTTVKWVLGAIIGVGGAAVIAILSDDEDPASPF